MNCTTCGTDNPAFAQFCGGCGASMFALSMVSFPDAIRLGFRHYFDFRSRSTRAEYWWWALFLVLADVILSVADIVAGTYNFEGSSGLISGLFSLAILVPSFALGARRLHDINKSGWWQLLWFGFLLVIPVIVLIVWAIRRGDEGTNKYGPDPRHTTS